MLPKTAMRILLVGLSGIFCFAHAQTAGGGENAGEYIDLAGYTERVKTLASDAFEGRSPSSTGEEKTIHYLESEFEKLGLQPGNGDSFFQKVPLVQVVTSPEKRLEIQGVGRGLSLEHGSEYVALTRRLQDEVAVEASELVFAGYGIVAPEYQWNDYAGLDVRGKTVLLLVNDPGFATRDSSFFTGRAMTYYGRWTYKYEEAARQGAAGVLIIHETAPAGYPWHVVQSGWTGPEFYLETADQNMSRCKLEGWVSGEAARRLFEAAGWDYPQLTREAARPGFTARSMGLSYYTILRNDIQRSESNNVIALQPGTDRADEYLIYTAHWDHFGKDSQLNGDQIYNGARDNATGTAALVELAEAFRAINPAPRRSILFLAVTAEEQGLLGSAYYAAHPVYPLAKTVAVLNMDALNIFGEMKDITVVGLGKSELDQYVRAAAEAQGRYVRPDPEPEKGIFFRSDHFSFAKEGVPALYTKMGIDHLEKSPEEVLALQERWTAEFYHKPGDEYDPDTWDLRGAIQDIRLMFRVGLQLSREDVFPRWKEGTAFKEKREADLRRKAD